jgi:hypothetical protein
VWLFAVNGVPGHSLAGHVPCLCAPQPACLLPRALTSSMLHGSECPFCLVIFRAWYCSSHLLMFCLGCRRVLSCGGSYARSAFFAPAHCARHARWYSFCVLRRSRLLSLCSCMLQLLHAPPRSPLLTFCCCASGVLLECPVTVVSVLISTFCFALFSVVLQHWKYLPTVAS